MSEVDEVRKDFVDLLPPVEWLPCMVLLLLLGVMAVCRQRRPVHGLERLLRASYLVFVAYSVLRPAMVAVSKAP